VPAATDPALPAANIDVALFHDVMHHVDNRAATQDPGPLFAVGRIVVIGLKAEWTAQPAAELRSRVTATA
jgi:hypothetical protein